MKGAPVLNAANGRNARGAAPLASSRPGVPVANVTGWGLSRRWLRPPNLLIAAGLAAVAMLAIPLWIQLRYTAYIHTDVAQVQPAPVAIVFGAGIQADGGLSPMLADRVDRAIELYRAGKVRKLLMSGDNRFVWYDEPTRMYEYAVARGVPAEDIVRDFAGRRTYDTCYRAGAIFQVRQAVLITQRFHLARALFTCRNLGVDAVGLTADRGYYASNPIYQARDLAATLVAWWDVMITRPLPVLGDVIDIGI
jgi:SanA protein